MVVLLEKKTFIELSKEEKASIVGNVAVLKPMPYQDSKENAFLVVTCDSGDKIEKKAIVYNLQSATAVATLFDSEKR